MAFCAVSSFRAFGYVAGVAGLGGVEVQLRGWNGHSVLRIIKFARLHLLANRR